MVFGTIKYWFRKDTLGQILRDDAVTTAHAAAIARGESRILASGKDGNLFSYKLEEYGAERNSRMPITSVVGHIAWTGMWAIITAGLLGTSVSFSLQWRPHACRLRVDRRARHDSAGAAFWPIFRRWASGPSQRDQGSQATQTPRHSTPHRLARDAPQNRRPRTVARPHKLPHGVVLVHPVN